MTDGSSTFTNVQTAINSATAGDTLTLSGVCGSASIGENLTLIGSPTAELNAAGGAHALVVSSGTVSIWNLVITGGSDNTFDNGGAGIDNNGTLTLNGSTQVVRNGTGEFVNDGGGGVLNLGTLTLNGTSEIAFNSSGCEGGGIYNTGTIALNGDSQIYGNTAQCQGGGVMNESGALALNANALVVNNTAHGTGDQGGEGGGIFTFTSFGASTTGVTATNVSGNSPDQTGSF